MKHFAIGIEGIYTEFGSLYVPSSTEREGFQIDLIIDRKEDLFHQFEDVAIPLLEKYNGKILYRVRPSKEAFITTEEEIPYEIHFLDSSNSFKMKKENN